MTTAYITHPDCLRHEMGGRMAQHVEPRGAVGRNRLNCGVPLDWAAEVDQRAIDSRRHVLVAHGF